MKRHLFQFWKRRKPIRRPVVRTPLVLEPLESRLLFSVNVLSYEGYGAGSAGVNSNETQLTPANVSSGDFGKLFAAQLDGQVYAQPLVDNGVTITNGAYTTPGAAGVHNVVFVATENDTVYAIDADPASNGQILWARSFLDVNDPNDALAGATSVTAVPAGDISDYGLLAPTIGITSTPVIDPSTNIMYVIDATKQMVGGTAHYVEQVHAINISNGTEAAPSYLIGDTSNGNDNNTPIYVNDNGIGAGTVTDPANGQQIVQFNAMWTLNRSALSLVNGSLYAAFASHAAVGTYHGWILSWNVSNLSTSGFQLSGVLNDDPDNGDDGIWQAGAPLAFTADGSDFYVDTGNGYLNTPPDIGANGFPSDGNYAESVLEVAPDPSITEQNMGVNGWGFQIVDYFMPYNVMQLDDNDQDIVGGPVILPASASANIPGQPELVIAGSKNGKLYLINANDMGEYDPNNDDVLNSVPNGSGNNTPPVEFSGVVSTPAYFNGELYVVGSYSDFLKSFTINSDGTLTQDSESSETFGFEPGSPIISADGTSNGILWITNRNTNELQAYDPNNLSEPLWSSGQGANALGTPTKFVPPVVANGEVFVGTNNGLVVYGLNAPTAVPQTPNLSATVLSGTSVNLSWQDPSQLPNIATSYTIEESTDGVNFTPLTTASSEATSLMIGGLTPGTNYWFQISGVNSIGASPYSNVAAVTTSAASGIGGNSLGQLTYNGSATSNGSGVQLTDGGGYEAGSVFTSNPLDIDTFQTQFTFQIPANSNTADGFTFTIQNAGATAVGPNGGGLGYGPDTPGGSGGISQSVAVKFDLDNNQGEGDDSTGLYTDGASPTVPSIDLSGTGIDLHSGDVFQVNMSYDGTTLTVVIADTNTGATATQSYTIDIPGTVGGDTAYVGFTGGTGGLTSTQDILSWTFSSGGAQTPATPTGLSATPSSGGSVLLSWNNGSNNQTGYYLDRATDAAFTQNLITEALPGGPSSFTDVAVGLAPGGTYYYRLRAVNSSGSSVNTSAVAVTIPMPPPPPSNAAITGVTTNAIGLHWTDNAGGLATGYQIWRSANGGPFLLVATLPAGSTSWRDGSVAPGTAYEYSIVAYNVSGSNGAAEAGATTSPAPPVNPLVAASNAVTSLLPSLLQIELDAALLMAYIRLASSGAGESAALKSQILGLWTAIEDNPLMKTPLGLYAFAQAVSPPSGSAKK